MAPKFSAYPFASLRRLTRVQAQLESTLARWIAARARGERLATLVGAASVRADVVAPGAAFDPFAARCELRVPGGAALDVRGSSLAVRRIAQQLLGGPEELAAPRPLGVVEKSLWALVVATALEDLGVAGEVWPQLDDGEPDHRARATVELAVTFAAPLPRGDAPHGDILLAVQLHVPADLALRVPPSRTPAWFDTTVVEVPIVLGRCALPHADLARLAVRNLVTLERPAGAPPRGPARVPTLPSVPAAELAFGGGAMGLRAAPGALEAQVATGYVPRDMSLPDDAHVELTVALGTTRLSLRQLGDLAIGQIIQLGRPLVGPFELRAAGRVVGRGELVDVDGELAVRIVSLGD